MHAVSLPRWCAVAILVFLGMSCAPAHHRDFSECASGVGSSDRNHPLICVDDTTLSANPMTVTVNDRAANPDHTPSSVPVIVKWATRSGGGTLGLQMKDKGCFEPGSIKCHGGRCWAKTRKIVDGKTPVQCEYDLNLSGRVSDPTVIVEPCCM